MEGCQSSKIKNDDIFSKSDDAMISTHQDTVNSTMEENVVVQEEPECSFESKNTELSDDFLVNLLSRDSTVDSSNKEVTVHERIGENITSEAGVTEPWDGKDKAGTDCMTYTLEQNKVSDMEICNTVNSVNGISEIEIIKEVVIEETEQEIKVHKSAEENMISERDVVVEYDSEKEKNNTNCVIRELQQSKANDMLICNSVSSPKEEVEILKEVVIEDASPSVHRKQPVKNNSQNTFSKSGYRCDSDSWTDDDDLSTSDSSSSDSDTFFQAMHEEKSKPKILPPVKTKGELALDDLPPIEDLAISVNEGEMMLIGKIHAVVETLVIVRSLKDTKPLDLESVLFLSHDQPLGRIFDVFGRVTEPLYSIRFNNIEQINEKGVKVGADVFFAPEKSDITTYVFLEELQNQKGSDASWKHNNEPPEEFLDYSDDEKEKRAKDQRRAKNRNRQFSNCSDTAAKRPYLESRGNSVPSNYIPPPKPAPSRNNLQNISLRISRPNPFQSRIPPASPSPSVHSLMSPVRISRSNPFQSHVPPPSPAPSVCSLMSPVRIPNSYGTCTPHQPRRVVQNQNILYRPASQVLLSPYQQPHVFGQVTVLNPISPALRAPSPLPSPVMSNIPTLIPAPHFPSVASQNYFNQRFPRSPSPASHTQQMPPDPWLSNRSPDSAGVPPSHPLTVQIPNMNSPSFRMHQIPQDRCPVEQFVNYQVGNFTDQPVSVVNNNRNWSSGNMQPRFYHN